MFYNISNHPSSKWTSEQLEAAKALGGEVVDVGFPNVSPYATPANIHNMAMTLVDTTGIQEGDVVHCMGETGLVIAIVGICLARGAKCVVSTSERKSREVLGANGTVEKVSEFKFVQFREV